MSGTTFEEWWKENYDKLAGECGWEVLDDERKSKRAAEIAWECQQNSVDTLRSVAKKAIYKSSAYREALKKSVDTGCKQKGRCVSGQVNDNYCPHCRPIMNVMSSLELTALQVIADIMETEE